MSTNHSPSIHYISPCLHYDASSHQLYLHIKRHTQKKKNCKQKPNVNQSLSFHSLHTIPLFYNTFITVLYMFRATSFSSSWGKIVLIQHRVSTLSVSGRPVHRLRLSSLSTCAPEGHSETVTIPHVLIKLTSWRWARRCSKHVEDYNISLNLCTGRPLTESDDSRCCINTIWPPDDEHDVARNM